MVRRAGPAVLWPGVRRRTGSVEKEYNQAGEVVTELSNGGTGIGIQTQTFSYDARGEMTYTLMPPLDSSHGGVPEYRQYDADGRLIADVYTYASGSTVTVTNADGTFHMNISGWLSAATTYYYDADGRVSATFSYDRMNASQSYWNGIWNKIDNGTLEPSTESAIPSQPSLADAPNGYGVLGTRSYVSYTGAGDYDKEGNALAYAYVFYDSNLLQWHTTSYTVSYLKQDGYLEKATSGTSDDPNVLATTDTSLYDAFGRRIAIDTYSAGQTTDQVRAFAYDAEGEILQRRDGTATGSTFTVTSNGGYSTEHYAYVEGQQVGNVDEHGTINVLGGVTGFSNSEAGTTNYVAQDGDTMQSIAQAIYGDGSLWYVVADANGFDAATDAPAAGQTLKLPQVTTNSNTAETFKPYNPHEISGSTTPSLPQAPQPPPSAHHCSTLAEIVVIAVVIVASIYTAGAAAEAMGATEGSTWAAGGAAFAGTSSAGVGAGMAAAAAGAAVGNAAGQLVGDAEGIHQGFSWGEVAAAGLTAGATAGIGSAVASEGGDFSILAHSNGTPTTFGYAVEGAADYVAGVGANKLVGEPTHFSWAGAVANAVGSAVTSAAHLPTKSDNLLNSSVGQAFEGRLVDDVVTRETSLALGDNHVQSWQQIAEDVFGNALGNAAMGAINEAEWKAAQPSIDKQAGSIVDSIMGDSSAASSGADQYARLWNASLFGDGAFGGAAGSAAGSPTSGNYDLIATSASPEGYPVPVTDTSDPAVLDALYKNTTAFVNYERGQGLYGDLPPVPQPWDSEGLIGYNHVLQSMVWPDSGVTMLAPVNVVAPSAMQQDMAAANERQSETEQALSSWQGSFGGDLAYNAVTLLTRGGNDLIAGVESVKDVLTDGASAAQAVTGLGTALWDVGSAVAHPVNTYNRAVNGMTNWLEEPLDKQARDIGRFGIDTLLSFGAEGIAAKGLGYIDTLADGFGSAVDALGAEPMYGSRAAQAGMLDVGTVDPQAAIRARVLGNTAESQAARESSNFLAFGRRATAREFLVGEGYSSAKVNAILNGGGIDFSQPVIVRTFGAGTQVQQLVKAGSIGDWFGPIGQSADASGVAAGLREPWAFEASQNVRVLESRAAPVVDRWTLGENYPVVTRGGGIQWIPSNKNLFVPIQGPY